MPVTYLPIKQKIRIFLINLPIFGRIWLKIENIYNYLFDSPKVIKAEEGKPAEYVYAPSRAKVAAMWFFDEILINGAIIYILAYFFLPRFLTGNKPLHPLYLLAFGLLRYYTLDIFEDTIVKWLSIKKRS